jgi:hypothetical protein
MVLYLRMKSLVPFCVFVLKDKGRTTSYLIVF